MAFIAQIRQYPLRFLKTLALFYAMFVVGMAIAVIGPTMLDLTIQTMSELNQTAYILPARGGGHATGSFVAGILYSKMDYQLTASTYLILAAVIHVCITYCQTFPALIGTFFVDGLMIGLLEAGATIFLIDIWGKENPPFMQAFHFCFGLGSFIVPLISKPYLLPIECDPPLNGSSTSPISGDEVIDNWTISRTPFSSAEGVANWTEAPVVHLCQWKPGDVLLRTPYGIIAGLIAINAIFFILLFIFQRETKPHPSRIKNTNEINGNQAAESKTNWPEIIVIVLTSAFSFFYYGLEITFGSFLTAYSVSCDLKLEKSTGALITSLFWAVFTFFRLFAVFYIDFTGAEFNLWFELILIMIANVILIPFSNHLEWALWTGSAIMGLGASSIWASVFGFLEDYFPVKSHMTAAFIVSACVGEFVVPTVIANWVQSYPKIFLWVMLACSIAMIILMTLMSVLCRIFFRKKLPIAVGISMTSVSLGANDLTSKDITSSGDTGFSSNGSRD